MPKDTFFRLPEVKREEVLNACRSEFIRQPIQKASVSSIINTLGIARGSFYQYFDSLEECYFYILKLNNIDIHAIFRDILIENDWNLFISLEKYGLALSVELYLPEKYQLFKNRFLHWTAGLDDEWRRFIENFSDMTESGMNSDYFKHIKTSDHEMRLIKNPNEAMTYIKALVHELVRRTYLEDWSSAVFLEHYNLWISWIRNGIEI